MDKQFAKQKADFDKLTEEVNARYKTIVKNKCNYKQVYTTDKAFSFDEVGMDNIYKEQIYQLQ